ncbi:glycosyltransferase family 4 protein [Bacteroides cellulosilyticus]|uniref:glycosyltransferase family 4 protein n=1 Tax=Bacteroides cellulosilyticus TaxID=246787 RepID=UPI0032BFD8A2
MKKMKVLFVTHTSVMGGANRSLLQLIKELQSSQCVEPIVLAPKVCGTINMLDKCHEIGIPCLSSRFYWFKGNSFFKSFIKVLLNFLYCYPVVFYKLRKYNFDLVHSNGSVIDLGGYISRSRRVKHVWHLREFGELDFGLHSVLGKRYERFVYGMGDTFIAISRRIAQEYTSVIPKDKIKLIYNGVIPKRGDLEAKHLNGKTQFVLVGLIQSAKNQMEALRAIRLLVKEGCFDFHLTIIGGADFLYLRQLEEFVTVNKLNGYVTFLGECDNVPERLSGMDVGLMLSKNEAFGRVTVEYMLQNIAVIASNSGANPEIIRDGETGLLYPLGQIEALAMKMRTLIENKSFMINTARNGQKYAMSHFISQINTKAVCEIFLHAVR